MDNQLLEKHWCQIRLNFTDSSYFPMVLEQLLYIAVTLLDKNLPPLLCSSLYSGKMIFLDY